MNGAYREATAGPIIHWSTVLTDVVNNEKTRPEAGQSHRQVVPVCIIGLLDEETTVFLRAR
jgi:hypothetical protein